MGCLLRSDLGACSGDEAAAVRCNHRVSNTAHERRQATFGWRSKRRWSVKRSIRLGNAYAKVWLVVKMQTSVASRVALDLKVTRAQTTTDMTPSSNDNMLGVL